MEIVEISLTPLCLIYLANLLAGSNIRLSGYQKSQADDKQIPGTIEVHVENYFDLEPFTL